MAVCGDGKGRWTSHDAGRRGRCRLSQLMREVLCEPGAKRAHVACNAAASRDFLRPGGIPSRKAASELATEEGTAPPLPALSSCRSCRSGATYLVRLFDTTQGYLWLEVHVCAAGVGAAPPADVIACRCDGGVGWSRGGRL